jgi:diguanylate cyclase (GGDEF)-like protein
MWRGRPRSGVRALGLAAFGLACVAVVPSLGVLPWEGQVVVYRLAGPPFAAVAAVLCWHSARSATVTSVRRHWRLLAATAAVVTASYTVSLSLMLASGVPRYPVYAPAVQVLDLFASVLAVAAVLAIPAATPWSASRLRLGLDMMTVQIAGVVFLWYFSVSPALARSATAAELISIVLLGAAVLVAVFAVTRTAIVGTRGVDRRALGVLALVGLAELGTEATSSALSGGHPRVGLPFILGGAFRALLIAYPLVSMALVGCAAEHGEVRATRRRPFSTVPYVAVAATHALLIASLVRGADARTWSVLVGTVVLTGLVVARQVVALRDNAQLVLRLDDSLQETRGSLEREQFLAEVGKALLTHRTTEDVNRLAVDAANRLIGGIPGSRATVALPVGSMGDWWTVVAAAGDHADECIGARFVPPSALDGLRARLAAGESINVSNLGRTEVSDVNLAEIDASQEHAIGRPVLLLPLGGTDRLFGVLCASAHVELPPQVRQPLATLRTQISLALDGVRLTQEMTRRALLDPLTGLANRTLLRDRFGHALVAARRRNLRVAVLLLDLDGFKPINDTFGHEGGDQVLRVVAERLRECVRAGDFAGPADLLRSGDTTVGRLGGDEFVLLVENVTDIAVATSVAERVIAALRDPISLGRNAVTAGVSVGVALSDADTRSVDDVLRRADAAMYAAKRRRTGGYEVYRAELARSPSLPVP